MTAKGGPTPGAAGAGQNHAGNGPSTLDPELNALVGSVLDKLDRVTQLEEANAASLDREDRPRAHVNPRTGAFEVPGTADVVLLSELTPRPIRWIWKGWLARGKLTLLSGDPGTGKSFVSHDVAARLSSGLAWPDGSPASPPGGVVLVSGEDDPEDTILPRLLAAGGNAERVALLRAVKVVGGRLKGVTVEDLPAIEEALARVADPALLVVDPLAAHLGKVKDNNNAEVRGALAGLVALAQRVNVALLVNSHLPKGSVRAAVASIGSVGITAAARVALVAIKDPERPDRRLLLTAKSNIGNDRRGLAYRIVDGDPIRLVWEPGLVEVTLDALLENMDPARRARDRGEAPAVGEAVEFVRSALDGRVVPVRELEGQGREAGISLTALRRARHQLGLRARPGAFGGAYVVGPLGRGTDGATDPVSPVSTTSRKWSRLDRTPRNRGFEAFRSVSIRSSRSGRDW